MKPLEHEINLLHSRLCAGLADPKRILILYMLSEGMLNVTELSESLEMPQPTVSRHLKMLRERHLVDHTREGTSVYYSISDERIIQALDLLRAVLADQLQEQADLAKSVTETLSE
ncbi:MAG: metalloregulator ArsR/SmtB family transcription factor [Anaerolineales bacterium]|nr:metalloregulator ArsR/SmtB family transcription factor [Anaerolineales bacterium]